MNRPEIMLPGQAALAVADIGKAFGPTIALSSASFDVAPGTVHALMGENGAGKSTLIKIMSGLLRPDKGSISISGNAVQIEDRRMARELGIETAFQELTQVQDLTVTQNLLMPYQPRGRFFQLKHREAEEMCAAHLSRLGLKDISPREDVGGLSLPNRQKLEIARAIFRNPSVLLLDEPTSSLSGRDIDWLGDIIEDQAKRKAAVLFISHRTPEVRLYCSGLTILRNGKTVGSFACADVSDEQLIEMIIGRSLKAMFPARTDLATDRRALLEVSGLKANRAADISFSLGMGEIVGVAALQGMGQLDVFKALSGDIGVEDGTISIEGVRHTFHSPRDAIDCAIGVSFLPEDRKTEALFLKLDGRFNATLPILSRISRLGVPHSGMEDALVADAFKRVQVADWAMYSPMSALSGGNQQKVVMAKWLLADSKIMLLYDPTRGVDVGTKAEIYGLLRQYVRNGGGVLIYSTEIEELTNLCDRVLVIYDGRIVHTIDAKCGPIMENEVMRSALGTNVELGHA